MVNSQRYLHNLLLIWLLSASLSTAADNLEQGTDAYSRRDYPEALQLFTGAARQGDPKGEFGLGVLYFEGKGVPKDLAESRRWFLKAAKQGHILAAFNLGNAYQFGRGVKADPDQAVFWWQQAAFQGYPNAGYNLGVHYLESQTQPGDYELGVAWLRSAAHSGWEKAITNLQILDEPLVAPPIDQDDPREPARSEATLLTINPGYYTVQLYSGRSKQSAIEFLTRLRLADQAWLYRLPQPRKKVRWNVLFGVYTSKQEALDLIAKMRPELKQNKPWPRKMGEIRQSILQVWKRD